MTGRKKSDANGHVRRKTAARMPAWMVKGCAATRVGRIAKRNHATRKMGKLGAASACVSVEISETERLEIERRYNGGNE